MSRHEIDGRDPTITITLGWDNADDTYRAEVRKAFPNGDYEIVAIIGEEPGEISSPEELAAALEPYTDLDEAMLFTLAEDRAFEIGATHPVSPDQYVMPLDQPDVEKENDMAVPRSAIESAVHQENMQAAKPPPQSTLERLRDFMGVQAGKMFDDGVGIVGNAIKGIRNGWENMVNHGRDAFSMHDVGSPGIHGTGGGVHGPDAPAAASTPSSPSTGDLYGPEPHSLDERMSVSDAYKHAKNAPGVRAEMDAALGTPYSHTAAPDYVNRGSVYGASDAGQPMSPADRASLYGFEPELPEPSQEQAIETQGPER